jgi:hypothetical protein
MQTTINPASKLQPPPIPRVRNKGLAKWIAATAKTDRVISAAANRLAAYCGYICGRYRKSPWKITKTPMGYIVTPTMGTIQWTSDLAVHPKTRMPMGGRKQLAMAGRRTCSG